MVPINYLYLSICSFTLLSLYSCGQSEYIPPGKPSDYEKPLMEANRIVSRNENITIDKYIERRGWDMKETGTGLRYMIYKTGRGDSAKAGQIATLSYTLHLLDGTLCYSSEKDGLKQFEISHGGVERGLEEGILLMQEGSRARFILPSHLGWGLPGDGDKIPMKVALVYDVELVNLEGKPIKQLK